MAASIYFVVADSDGDTSTIEVFFDAATPIAVLAAGVPALAALFNPVLNGGLRRAGFRIEVDVSGTWGPVAALISDVQEKAEFAMRTAGSFLSRLNLPTFDENFFIPGTGNVDLADAAIVAIVDFLEDGITAGGGSLEPTDYREDDFVTVERAVENWGKRRNAR